MGSLTSDLMDENPGTMQSCEVQFRQFGGLATFHGPIRTVSCRDDTVLVKQVLNEPGNGQVLVIDGGGSLYSALMGDLTAGGAADRGWAGIVVFGAVRDVEALASLQIGIKAIGTSPRKPQQKGAGAVDVELAFGNATFVPGQLVWSDADGVVTSALRPASHPA